ncbi:MAG: hypothetical protein KJO70_05760 [Gammaproteobacteria bacterium]|nr:hypothetical protein [Gammaproteobacteria bacterium]MBT8050681.1 hypothetical protein [Gammaproteobacteria bacterium]NNJ77939.1 hypothetical protein [Xanthomonadales bacterium]
MNRSLPHSRLAMVRVLCMLTLAVSPSLWSAPDGAAPKLFDADGNLEVTITAPWQDLMRNSEYQGTYPATLTYTDSTGTDWSHDLTVERRGIKRQEVCKMPPIRLRFEKKEVAGSPFRGQDSLKMVTHCQKSDRSDQYYILEMLAYRMYNQITDFSFRVRPLSVTYKDSEGGRDEEDRFAFLIEDDSDVGKRNDLRKLEIPRVRTSQLEKPTSSEFALFQYMIGNTDWSALAGPDPKECCHNVKLVAPRPFEEGDMIWPVAYDFDASGIVDAPYAAPPEGLGINSVTQRLYRGYCAHSETLPAARQKFLDKKADILAVFDSDERLNARSKKRALRFIERFYDILEDDGDFERRVVMKCRK